MLVLSRQVGESFYAYCGCGRKLRVQLIRARAASARLAIEAPRETTILREEVAPHLQPRTVTHAAKTAAQ